MTNALRLEKYSVGVGDRFAHQARAQLRACIKAAEQGVDVTPVWNKSYREHGIVGSKPPSVLAAAEAAVKELGWGKPFHVDADHIRLDIVDEFIETSDFYTLDVADSIGEPASEEDVTAFVGRHPELVGRIEIPGIDEPFETTRAERRMVGDPRRSLQERYGDHEGYAAAVQRAAQQMMAEGFLIQEDVDRFVREAQASDVLR